MDELTLRTAVYKGSRQINLQDIPTAKATGFNAAADDYMERGIDLNEQLITNKPATFFFRMNSEAMISAGIQQGDTLIVDRSLPANSGRVIVAHFEGELIVRRLQKVLNDISLLAGNEQFESIPVNSLHNFSVLGVVTYVIHTVS